MFAALNIRKPKGITSHDVVARLRRIYGLKKIGHLGTLDPMAEGVLPVCLGQATRLIEYFPSGKRYTAEITLGRTTTTLDAEGETVSEKDCTNLDLSETRIEEVLTRYRGTITQQVPLYSAVHVGGKKLYELARKGQTADLPSREVAIESLELLSLTREDPAHPVLRLDVQCSAGTYIRSLARDIGEDLGCGGYLTALLRTGHGRFALEESISLETLQDTPNPTSYLLDPLPFLEIPLLPIKDPEQARQLANGMRITPAEGGSFSAVAVKIKTNRLYMAVFEGKPLAVVRGEGERLKPVKVFPSN